MSANDEAIEAWNTVLFDKFVKYRDAIVGGLKLHGDRALDRHPPAKGARVVDLGCGFGDTTIQIAKRVGPSGSAIGFDAAPRFIEVARDEARGVPNASFDIADLQAKVPGGPYDYAYSRMGMMFFVSPVIALRNVRDVLAPGGLFCMVVWRKKAANECFVLAEEAVIELLGEVDKGDQVTCGPGPFSMASADVLGDQLVAAGFTDIAFERSDSDMRVGGDLASAIDFALALGPAGEHVRLAGPAGVARRPEIEAKLRTTLAPFVRADGVFMKSATWIVTARRAT